MWTSKCISIAVDISKAFDTVSRRLLIQMIHRSRLRHNLVRWLMIVVDLRGRKASCLYQQHHSPSRQVQAGVPQGSVNSPALFNPFPSDYHIFRPRHDVLRRRLHVAGLCSQHRGGWGEGEPTQLFSGEVLRLEAIGQCCLEIQRDTHIVTRTSCSLFDCFSNSCGILG